MRAGPWFLLLAVLGSGSCALGTAPESDPLPPAPTLAHPDAAPHTGIGASRCSNCHSPEDRDHPRWKEIASRIGHDLDRLLAERKACTCCHLGEIKSFGEPLDRACLKCHDNIRVTVPAMASQHCVSCHTLGAQVGNGLKESAWECQKCHAEKKGETIAIDVHGAQKCVDCHRPHTDPWVVPRACSDCHPAATKTRHGKGHGNEACADCHKPHEHAGEAAGRCVSCHEAEKPAHTPPTGHAACTTCHAPHDFEKASVAPCAKCHTDQKTMQGRGAREHAECTSCHSPHDAGHGAKEACNRCHESLHNGHPDPEGKGCVGCHDPHPSSSQVSPVVVCSGCHEKATNDNAFHASILRCTSCHAPHDFAGGKKGCDPCHAKESAAAHRNAGHQECNKCHTPHAPTPAPACANCHAPEAGSAPKGHSKCTGCHDAHDGARGPAAACTNCHADKHKGAHGGRVDCASCHRAHGPKGPEKPPACVNCHAIEKLGGLHAIAKHQGCETCHSAHGGARSDRATCLSCHTDRQQHEPMAKVCAGCHAFR